MDKHNNISAFPKSTSLLASEWVAKLDGDDLTEQERQQLKEWLHADPKNQMALAEQMQQWFDMDVLSELTRLELNRDSYSFVGWLKKQLELVRTPRFLVTSLAVLLLAVVLNVVVVDQYINSSSNIELAIVTEIGERKSESLPDGSIVHVNTTSSAQVTYTRNSRSVVLESGEAFFDVAHDSERPFVVYAANTSIKAIGTAFAVHNDNDSISVSVTEGSVEFTSAGSSRIIAADKELSNQSVAANGNVAIYADDQTSINTQPVDEITRRLSWQDGMLEFRGESLEYVVHQLSRYTDAQIVIMDEDIKDERLGGYFKIGDIDGLASTLALGFNLHVDVVSDELIQISRGKNR